MKRKLIIALGAVNLAIGFVGAIIPLLPSFPFLLIAAVCFGKSSERLHNWFVSTKLYKNNLQSYVEGKGLSRHAKIRLMITVTLFMALGFIMMKKVPVGRIILGFIWLFHVLYFLFGVKTRKQDEVR